MSTRTAILFAILGMGLVVGVLLLSESEAPPSKRTQKISAAIEALRGSNEGARVNAAADLMLLAMTQREQGEVPVGDYSKEAIREFAKKNDATGDDPIFLEALPLLVNALEDSNDNLRMNAASALGSIAHGTPIVCAALFDRLADSDPAVRDAATNGLLFIRPLDAKARTRLVESAKKSDWERRLRCLTILDAHDDKSFTELRLAFESDLPNVTPFSITGLQRVVDGVNPEYFYDAHPELRAALLPVGVSIASLEKSRR